MAKIMVADDSVVQRKILKQILTEDGHKIVGESSDGFETLIMYDAVEPDLLILDYVMPGMNGLECLGVLKERHPDAKVIMLTACATKSIQSAAKALGCTAFLEKPYEYEELKQTVREVMKPGLFEGIIGRIQEKIGTL